MSFYFHNLAKVPLNNSDLCIKLSQPNYWQGNVISGYVELSAGLSRKVQEIVVKIKGVEQTRLKLSPKDIFHTQKKSIFCERIVLIVGNLIGQKVNYSFSYTLPSILPGTFFLEEGSSNYGLIDYYVTAVLHAKKTKPDNERIKARLPFKVQEKLNIPFARPVSSEQSNISLPDFGTLNAKMWVDRNVYFPGETVLARLKVNSTWTRSLRTISVNLVQDTVIQSSGHKSHDISVVHSEHQIPDLEPCFLGVRWVTLTIPPETPLSSSLGTLLRVTYAVQVKFESLLAISVPIIILTRQYFESEHAIRPPTAVLPPPTQVRPTWQPDREAMRCNGCNSRLVILYKSHCRNCGLVFCRECVDTKVPIPKLQYKDPVRVCSACEKIVKATGGTKVQSPRQVLEAWHTQYSPQWIPLYKTRK
jgi:hypothetical protein